MRVKRKIIRIDDELCDGCGVCVPSCAEGAIRVVDGKARVVSEKYCDGLGACLGECPKGALSVEEREAEEFDEEAVEEFLSTRSKKEKEERKLPVFSGCPSAKVQTFAPMHGSEGPDPLDSALSHWPVQINLVPSTAPFLQGADLLVTAACVPVAYSDFHRDFLKGKTVMIGCPKFDDVQGYVEKFTDILRTAGIRSVTVLDMEVPCCSALPNIILRSMELAGRKVPLEEITISTRGRILKRSAA